MIRPVNRQNNLSSVRFARRQVARLAEPGTKLCATCGMEVDPRSACRTELGGKAFYFCRAQCKSDFKKAYFRRTTVAPVNASKSSKKHASCH